MTDDNLQETAAMDAMRRRGRRRLVGAIVLALIAIIFVPVLLQKAPEPLGEDVEITIPAPETTTLPPVAPEPTPPVAVPEATPSTEPLVELETPSTTETVEEAPTPPLVEPPALPAEEKSVIPKAVALQDGTFAVQLGAYTDDKGANSMVNRLKRAGYPAYTEPNMTRTQMVWRVRVGPFKNRGDANTVLAQLKKEGHDGQVVPAR